MSTSEILRTARAEVIPQIPGLAPRLYSDREVVLGALRESVETQGRDPDSIGWRDYNRAERQSISGFFIDEQTDFLVEGSGTEARFRLDAIDEYRNRGPSPIFAEEIDLLLDAGARYVQHWHTHGDFNEQYWRPAARRYRGLQLRANFHAAGRISDSAAETWFLSRALRSKGLSSSMGSLVDGLKEDDDIPAEEKVSAGHELVSFPLMVATMHIRQFNKLNLMAGEGAVVLSLQRHSATGRRRIESLHSDGTPYRDRRQMGTVKLKCPAHAIIKPQDGSAETDKTQTALRRLAHASINLAADQYELGPVT